jgi:hypothetical protein
MAATKQKKRQRIDWGDLENIDCVHLANYGLHAKTIGKATGLSRGQIYYRAKQVGVRLRDYRDGKGPVGHVLLRKFTVRSMESTSADQIRRSLSPVIKRRLQERKRRIRK